MPKIKSLLFLVQVLFLGNIYCGHAQDYRIYHLEIMKAETLIVSEAFEDALKTYETLFKDFDFIFLREYQVAAQLALHLGNLPKATEYIRKGILSGWQMKSLKRNAYLAGFRKTHHWKALKKNYTSLHQQYNSRIDTPIRSQVKKMYLKDQWKAFGALFTLGSKGQDRYAEKRFAPHSQTQIHQLLSIFDTHGYPGERLIGNNFWMSTILSHHNSISSAFALSDTLYPNLKPQLTAALQQGQISPFEYVLIDEWYRLTLGNMDQATYGIVRSPSRGKLPETNALRESAYLRSVKLSNQLFDLQEKTGMDFYLRESQWAKGKIKIQE